VIRLNKAGRVLQASGSESDVVEEEAELAHSADGSVVQQTGRSPESRPYVLGNRWAKASQRQQRSWGMNHPGVEELPTTVSGLTPIGLVAPTNEFMESKDRPQADPLTRWPPSTGRGGSTCGAGRMGRRPKQQLAGPHSVRRRKKTVGR
jgi:hypothetical protein